jgi:hypothetical protein
MLPKPLMSNFIALDKFLDIKCNTDLYIFIKSGQSVAWFVNVFDKKYH